MIASRRVVDNPLGFLKDDLLLALRRIELDLETGQEALTDASTLEAMIDAIDQVRNPLAMLEHREAVALLDEMRATLIDAADQASRTFDPALMKQAADQLTGYLQNGLAPGRRQANADALTETMTSLRQLRQSSVTEAAAPDPLESSARWRNGRDLLKQLQQTMTEHVENAADEIAAWAVFQQELAAIRPRLAEQGWERVSATLDRLNRIVDTLIEGSAEHYGVLVGSVCAEFLAQLGYALESPDQSAATSTILNNAEAQLAQLDTLLGLPSGIRPAPAPPARPNRDEESLDMPLDLELDLPDLPEFGAPAAGSSLPAKPAPTAPTLLNDDFEWLDLPAPEAAASGKPPPAVLELPSLAEPPGEDVLELPSLAEPPGEDVLELPSLEDAEALPEALPAPVMAAAGGEDLVSLLALSETDPEFVEVFLEEARGELESIRAQLVLWRANLEDGQALTPIRRAFHTLKGSGRMVGAMVIGDFAWEFENLLNQVLEGRLPATLEIVDAAAAAVEALAPLVGEQPLQGGELAQLAQLRERARTLLQSAPPVAPPAPPAPVSPVVEPPSTRSSARLMSPDMDTEFIEVFLEEARGELESIREHLALWRANLEDRQALTTMRRAFHTLKGSGRVVGAMTIGDCAWCFENLLNQVLNGATPATSAIVDLLDEAVTVLEGLLGEDAAIDAALARLPELTARVEALPDASAEVALPEIEAPMVEAPVAKPAEPVLQAAPVAEPPVLHVPSPVDTVIAEPVATAPGIDAEMAQVFQYEADEILDASDALLQQLGDEPDNAGLLNDLRRGMHTLKGSSRMAGIMTVGDLAHAAESVLDGLGKGLGQVTPVVLDALQHTLDRLNQMLAEAASGVSPAAATDLIHDLHQLADSVASGEPREAPARPAPTEETPSAVEPPVFQPMTELDQELAQAFQTEAGEILDSSDAILQRLRAEPESTELLNDLRREMHTLKGSSRMAGFMTVGDVAHAAESVLDALGKGALQASGPVLDKVQSALDHLHQMLAGILGGQPPAARPELIAELHGVLGRKPEETARPAAPVAVTPTPAAAVSAAPAARRTAEPPAAAPADAIRVSATLLNTLVNQMGESSIFRARIDQGVGAMSNNLNDFEQTITRLRRQVTHLAIQAESRIRSQKDEGIKAHEKEFDPLELDRFTELQQLSRSLMEIADDLGNIGNNLNEHAREITALLDQQGKVNKEIQQGLMRTGMVRFGSIIPRLRRVVRQAAQDLGKRAELQVDGEGAEVDRTVLESMLAPLEHMLRNSLAHGIESPEQRRAAGKPEIGSINLSLRREGAELVLELTDDGGGINFAAIRTKGEEKGLLLPGQPATEDELIALLLQPGFSTAASVTQVSGRGVGMDVVNEAIRAMRGALLINTDPGRGTRFIIRLPFSLAVTQALLVQAGEGQFAIPLLSIEVVTRLKENELKAYLTGEQVQHQYSTRQYPVHNLGILVGSEHVQPFDEVKDRRPPALLFRSAEASAALQVEAVLGNQEIIVKPISPQFNGVPGLSGATVLGDGRVVVVLELAALVRNVGSQRQKQMESRALRAARQEARQDKLTVMVIDDSITMRKVTARILERHNIQAVTAKDGLDAVAMLQTQVPDLAVLDIEMPRMDGFEVVAHVRNQSTLRHLPIIMVTSRGGEKHRERAMSLGVNDYLTKPYQEDQLMNSIRNILGERALDLIT